MRRIDNNTLFFGNYVDADLQLVDLRDYLGEVSKFITRKRKYREKKFKDNILKDVALNMFTESFSSTLYVSAMVSLWVFMESELRGYCRAMRQAMNLDLKYSDIHGSTIDRFKIYTSKVAKLDFGLTNENWEDLRAICEIRNSIVHSDGLVKNKDIIRAFCRRHKLIGLLHGDRVTLDGKSLATMIGFCISLIRRIYVVALKKFPKESD